MQRKIWDLIIACIHFLYLISKVYDSLIYISLCIVSKLPIYNSLIVVLNLDTIHHNILLYSTAVFIQKGDLLNNNFILNNINVEKLK